MSAPKRTPGQREKDREIISEMWVQKVPQRIMAERLGISQSQVFREIQKLKQRWQASADCNTKEVIADSLEELRYCKARLWEAYERSCKDAEISTTSIVKGRVGKDGVALPDLTKAQKVAKGQTGDPHILNSIAAIIEQECRIHNVIGPQKISLTDPSGTKEYHGDFSDAERAALLAAFLERHQSGEFVGEGGGEAGLGRPHAGDGPLLPGQATDYDSSGTAA